MYDLNIQSPEFATLRAGFDKMLNSIVATMYDSGTSSASLSMKLDIYLFREPFTMPDGSTRWANKPAFAHKFVGTIQQKTETSGKADFASKELVWDNEQQMFLVAESAMMNGQVSMFEEE